MRKSGLHKQISSIFDGVPIPQNKIMSGPVERSESETQTQNVPETEILSQQQASESPAAKPSLVTRLSADPSECAAAPSIQVGRPMPIAMKAIASPKKGPGIVTQAKQALFGTNKKSLDPHQKKMAGLVGILAIVFGVVLFISLGGVGKTQAMAADSSTDSAGDAVEGSQKTVRNWQSPQPLSADLRDATRPLSKSVDSHQGEQTDVTTTGGLIVKGIVFSKNKPSAIINNQILNEGQTLNGIQILQISKDFVEFQANGKRWKQQVQQ